MNWNEFAKEVHQVAVEHGWYDRKPSFAEMAVNFHAELSEAVEEYRKGSPMVYCDGMGTDCVGFCSGVECLKKKSGRKLEGVAVELADCILRILDTLAEAGVDIERVITYPIVGADIITTIARCHQEISDAYTIFASRYTKEEGAYQCLIRCIGDIMGWAKGNGVDMEAILRAKHEHNKTRPYRHGGKVM